MYTIMDKEIDQLLLSPSTCNPSQALSTTTINDPAFTQIYDYLCDFSNTPFDTTSLFNPNGAVNSGASNAPINSPVDDYQQSRTVHPVSTISALNDSRISSQEQQQPILQFDTSKSGKIEIISHPRSKFRPRTEKESKDSSHYIRCEDYIKPEYPTIRIPREWNKQNNIIQITLVGNDKQPHPYIIESKERQTSSLIFKQNEQNSLYFHVTKQDYEKGEKTFLIEHIKPKQEGNITKDLIKTRQLEQSMLRFTRFYQISDGSYHGDNSSTEYSCLMIEDYGDFTVEDIFPLYGPMCGNQKVCVELKGHVPKDLKTDLIINITQNEINWFHQIKNIKNNQKTLTFLMPPFPIACINRAEVNILFIHKEEIIHRCNYIYMNKIDEELAKNNSNQSATTVPSSNIDNDLIGALPICSSTRMDGENQGVKRARQ